VDELLLVIVVLVGVLVIGGAALLVSRRRPPPPETPPETPPSTKGGATALEEPEAPTTEAPPERAPPPFEAPPVEPPEVAPPLTPTERFRDRLGRARSNLGASVASIFGRGLSDDVWEDLEESLIAADVGVEASTELVEGMRERVRAEGIHTGAGALALLKEILRLELGVADRMLARRDDGTTVWLVTGVNGTGKTTSIGKLAAKHTREGENVVLAAADTFRAAAADQLERWGEDAGARVVRAGEGADPASVAFDGYASARSADADLLLVDTAGRLQNKTALMEELRKVKRVLERESGPCDEVLLVLDATTGQNGLAQAKAFMEAVDVTGVVLTKLDGTARGGIVIAIQRQLGLPVKLVGLGEGIDDLAEFDPDAFVEALFGDVAQDVDLDEGDGNGPRG
jgi:fused signal recognition particle receptor